MRQQESHTATTSSAETRRAFDSVRISDRSISSRLNGSPAQNGQFLHGRQRRIQQPLWNNQSSRRGRSQGSVRQLRHSAAVRPAARTRCRYVVRSSARIARANDAVLQRRRRQPCILGTITDTVVVSEPVTAARNRRLSSDSLPHQRTHRQQGDSQQSGRIDRADVHTAIKRDSNKSLGQDGRHYRRVSQTVNRQFLTSPRPNRQALPSGQRDAAYPFTRYPICPSVSRSRSRCFP